MSGRCSGQSLAFVQRCPGQRSVWFKAVRDSAQLDSKLYRTALSWIQSWEVSRKVLSMYNSVFLSCTGYRTERIKKKLQVNLQRFHLGNIYNCFFLALQYFESLSMLEFESVSVLLSRITPWNRNQIRKYCFVLLFTLICFTLTLTGQY